MMGSVTDREGRTDRLDSVVEAESDAHPRPPAATMHHVTKLGGLVRGASVVLDKVCRGRKVCAALISRSPTRTPSPSAIKQDVA